MKTRERWRVKKCGCVKAQLVSAGEKIIIRCERHRDKTFKNRVHCHFEDGMVRRG